MNIIVITHTTYLILSFVWWLVYLTSHFFNNYSLVPPCGNVCFPSNSQLSLFLPVWMPLEFLGSLLCTDLYSQPMKSYLAEECCCFKSYFLQYLPAFIFPPLLLCLNPLNRSSVFPVCHQTSLILSPASLHPRYDLFCSFGFKGIFFWSI